MSPNQLSFASKGQVHLSSVSERQDPEQVLGLVSWSPFDMDEFP